MENFAIVDFLTALNVFISLASLIFTFYVYFVAKRISKRFLEKGYYRTPGFGLEFFQKGKKLSIMDTQEDLIKIELNRKPFLIEIPKNILFSLSGNNPTLSLYVTKHKSEINKLKDDTTKLINKFQAGYGTADSVAATNVLFISDDDSQFMVFPVTRMIEDNHYSLKIYFDKFYKNEEFVNIKKIDKGDYYFIFACVKYSDAKIKEFNFYEIIHAEIQ